MTRIVSALASIALVTTLSGCPWIGPALEAERLDPDGDGVPWPEDCDSDSKQVSDKTTFYADVDGDGFGDANAKKKSCELPDGYADNSDDCDDGDPLIGLPRTFERDEDRDTYGVPLDTLDDCFPPDDGWVLAGGPEDCDDSQPLMNPGMDEICNDCMDNNCDGSVNQCTFEGGTYSVLDPMPQGSLRLEGLAWARFGSAGAIGDIDGDTHLDLLIGARSDDSGGNVSGMAYVLDGPFGPGPTVMGSDVASRGLWGDANFWSTGASAAIAGNVDGTGQTLLLGAPSGSQFTGYWGGALGIFSDQSTIYPTSMIAATADYQALGSGVVALGDVNSDGFDDFAYNVSYPPYAGVYIVNGPTLSGQWVHPNHPFALEIVNQEQWSPMGESMVLADIDGDGTRELWLSDPRRAGGWVWQIDPTATGSVLITDQSGVPNPAWDEVSSDEFGHALATADVNGDGIDDLLIGSPNARDANNDSVGGVAVMYGSTAATPTPEFEWVHGDAYGRWGMGTAVAAAGDLDEDGFDDVLVHWPGSFPGYGDGGGALVIYGGPNGTFGDRTATFLNLNNWDNRVFFAGGVDLNEDGVDDLLLSEGSTEMHGEGATTIIFGQGY